MRSQGCGREDELLDALHSARWPAACDPQLRAHVDGCADCTSLLAVAGSLLDERHALVQQAQVPSSAIVWWRAQMRSKREAAEKAARPISFVQGVAVACFAGLLATALGIFVPTFRRGLGRLGETAGTAWSSLSLTPTTEALADPIVLAAVAAIGLCALVLPIALYFTLHED
jgi:hypothetical protein